MKKSFRKIFVMILVLAIVLTPIIAIAAEFGSDGTKNENPLNLGSSSQDSSEESNLLGVHQEGNLLSLGLSLQPYGLKRPIVIPAQPPNTDCSDMIQNAFNSAASQKIPVSFENTSGNEEYHISKTLILPNNLVIIGNSATVIIDSNHMTTFTWGKTNTVNDSRYREFCIMSEGMLTKEITTFRIDGLNFILRDDTDVRTVPSAINDKSGKNIPATLIGFGYFKDVKITNSRFSAYSTSQRGLTTFDVYTTWNNLEITNCAFDTLTDGYIGGVWLRNHAGEKTASNALIENCVFNNQAADEILTLYANNDAEMSNITVRNSKFNCFTSPYNNPAHLISLGNTGKTTDIVFENNKIHMEAVGNSVIKIREATRYNGITDRIYVRNNEIVVDDILLSASPLIYSDDIERDAVVEGNRFTLNTTTNKIKHGVSGNSTKFINNTFKGNGFDTVFFNVKYAKGNYIENCKSAFVGIVDCINNTVDECYGNLIMITDDNYIPNSSNLQDINIKSNRFASSNRAPITTKGNATPLYCRVVMENNMLRGGRIWSNNTTASIALYNNELYIKNLDDLAFPGKITEMSGNILRDTNGTPLISASQWPQGNHFNDSVAVGVTVEVEKDVLNTNLERVDAFVGYKKMAVGTREDTWVSVTATMYRVTVTGGTGGGHYAAGDLVVLTADPAPAGQVFKEWQVVSGGISVTNNQFTMPTNTVTMKAIFESISPDTHTIVFDPAGGILVSGSLIQTVTKGSGAVAPTLSKAGYLFAGWDNDFSNITADITVTAQWRKTATITTGGGSKDSGSSSGGSGGASRADTAPTTSSVKIGKAFTKPDATKLLNVALATKSEGVSSITIRARNYTSVDKAVLAELAALAKKNGVTLTIHFDTVKNGKVISRISVNPAAVTTNLDLIMKLVGNKFTLSKFAVPVAVVVTMPMGMTIATLKITGDGKDITTTAKPWLDKNGYLHFTTTGGEIVLSTK